MTLLVPALGLWPEQHIPIPITFLAESVDDDGIFIPSNNDNSKFTQFAIDNLKFCKHTPDGTTVHGTTHNIYQHSRGYQFEAEIMPTLPCQRSHGKQLAQNWKFFFFFLY